MFKSHQGQNAILAISVATIFVISGCFFSTSTEAGSSATEAKQNPESVVVSTIDPTR
ncbi:hypothetical protein [Rubellicoccus peritrichatus]|uniref:Uncharacterized protein n=1 Tax=Rubellicoccus peritrichatus TaxID=3080537 RepID=A0AAQ3L7A3_9BACT|nr:hypothetical protein [Puniceicoccus sp. CR14]WOO40919.1 hypothetical protein RZN69_20040 [Puniceicoccus sp. CR14]